MVNLNIIYKKYKITVPEHWVLLKIEGAKNIIYNIVPLIERYVKSAL